EFFLIDDCVDGDGGLTSLPVADDQLTLSTADGNHRVDGFNTSLQWLLYWFTVDNSRRLSFHWHFVALTGDGTFTVDGFSEGIDHAANHSFTYLDGGDLSGTGNLGSFLDAAGVSHQYHTHIVLFEVKRDGANAILKF